MAIPTFGNKIAPWLNNGNESPFNNSSALLGVGLGLISGKTAQDQVGQAAANFANNRTDGKTYNKTVDFLKQSDPDLAQAVESGALGPGDAYKLYLAQKVKADRALSFQTLADGTYGSYDGTTGTFTPLGKAVKPAGEGGNEFFGTTVPYYDADHVLRYKQLSKNGGGKDIDFGPGGVAAPPVKTVDVGDGTQPIGPGAVPVGPVIPKNLANAATQTNLGKAQADAAAALLPAQQIAGQIDQQIAELKADPSLPDVLGPIDSRTPNIRSGPIRAQSKIDQLKGGSFLSARQMLKGGGPITDFEGKKADAAVARMEQAQDVKDFNDALDDFNDAVQSGVQKLQMQAQGNFGVQGATGGAPATTAPAGAVRKYNPATGRIE